MAPKSGIQVTVELHESDITKPSPLRIIKRSQTISSGFSTREGISRRRPPSGSSDQSQGSPPMGTDRPLTVRKKRHGRGSIFGSHFDGACDSSSGSYSDDAPQPDDNSKTPKAKYSIPKVNNVNNPGIFLKSELQYSAAPATCAGRYARGGRDSNHSTFSDYDIGLQYPKPGKNGKGAERKLSKSKNLFLKAIGGRGTPQKAKLKKSTESLHKNTLVRRLSRKRNTDHFIPFRSGASSSTRSSFSDGRELDRESRDITDTGLSYRTYSDDQTPSSSYGSDTRPLLGLGRDLVLSPRVVVTPECPVVDSGNCVFWVAIEISGVLRDAEGSAVLDEECVQNQSSAFKPLGNYGTLHSMRIDFLPTPKCFITELFGDLHDSTPLRAGQTRLILARVNLGESSPKPSECGYPSSANLISDLETQLGDTYCPYLTVRLSYKHSAFQNDEASEPHQNETGSHITHLQTDVVTVIKRHDSRSVWSPQNSLMGYQANQIFGPNPLTSIVYQHLPADEADAAMRRLAPEKAARQLFQNGRSSEDTVKPSFGPLLGTSDPVPYTHLHEIMRPSNNPLTRSQSVVNGINPFARLPDSPRMLSDETDPARKIWNQMRRTSLGRSSLNPYGTYSTNDYYGTEDEFTPTRKSSSNVPCSFDGAVYEDVPRVPCPSRDDAINHRRDMIAEFALKNKRSLGAETLRSMAPSIIRNVGKSTKAVTVTVGGLGLGAGRSWGWGPPWW